MIPFVHLHLHSEYSLLDGACRFGPLLEEVGALGQTALALTDHGSLYGAVEFYQAAKAKGIKPIIGCEVYVAPRSRFDRVHEMDAKADHLVLLCENEVGYQNLMALVSAGHLEGFYHKPRVDEELLERYSGGLIALSACLAGKIPRLIVAGELEQARQTALRYRQIFGEDHFYLEVQDHGIAREKQVLSGLVALSRQTGIPLCATNDVHYVKKTDTEMHKVLLCIGTATTVQDPGAFGFETDEFYLKSGDEMATLFGALPGALENTLAIAQRCNVEFTFGALHLPSFMPPGGQDPFSYLQQLCEQGFERRYADRPEQRERLSYELAMIRQMGYVDYFLIVQDFIAYARSAGIPVGPGRGSAAGSLVSYCLGITDVDPVRFGLIFERFLNPDRVSMPDIDIDFCYNRRGEVIDYVKRKYGEDHVAQIVTFGTMAARAALRDVGRALGMPYAQVDAVAKLVPSALHITLEEALVQSPRLKEGYDTNRDIHKLVDLARAVEGMARHASTHAAGVVITGEPVWHYVPLARTDEGAVTQYTMTTLEQLGLLKMDFLGLRTLTVIEDTIGFIRAEQPDFSLDAVDQADPKVFEMLSAGLTEGLFQLESPGVKNVLRQLKPTKLSDIIAVISLYRPGPMESIPRYIEVRHNPASVRYAHPLLEPILADTYGCIVYQEQVMQIVQSMAGYSMGRADLLRRAMSKKKADVMAKEREIFLHGLFDEQGQVLVEGAVRRGAPEQVASAVFDEMTDFAKYAFNKAHAAAYGLVAYREAYLKCHYPAAFFAALMTSVSENADKIFQYVTECRRMGITVLPPDINKSADSFAPETDGVRFGLGAVLGVGHGWVALLERERQANGLFFDFYDFCERMGKTELNRRALEGLIRAGAFDAMGHGRFELLGRYSAILDELSEQRRSNLDGQLDLFGTAQAAPTARDPMRPKAALSLGERLAMERESLGFFLSGHPMRDYESQVKAMAATPLNQLAQLQEGQGVLAAGLITSIKRKSTKNASTMAFVTLEDLTGSVEVMVFAEPLSRYEALLRQDSCVAVHARLSLRDDGQAQLVCQTVQPIEAAARSAGKKQSAHPEQPQEPQNVAAAPGELRLYLKVTGEDDPRMDRVKGLLGFFCGAVPVYVYFDREQSLQLASRSLFAAPDQALHQGLVRLLGEDCVKWKRVAKKD